MKNKNTTMHRYALHRFASRDDIRFSLEAYSKLKYGSGEMGRIMGEELALGFFDKYNHIFASRQVVVMESAYASIKNAASILTDSFVNKLNTLISEFNGAHIERTKINRVIPYIADYGKVSLAKRQQLLKKDKFTLDYDFVADKFLVFLDDVMITGTHQRKLEEMMRKYGLNMGPDHALCVYYAELDNPYEDPAIESYLNSYTIDSLVDLDELIKNDNDYHVVVRTVKTILQEPDIDNVKRFINDLDSEILEEIFYACLGEGYYKNPAFSTNFALLRNKYLEICG